MSRYEIEATTVQVPHHTLLIDAYLAQPKAKGSFPAVVVFQEIFGVNAHIRDVVERIAKEGYVAIAPALYQRSAPGFEVGYRPENIEIGREYKAQTTAPNLIGDTQAAIAYLRQLSNVRPEAIGTIGFCFGGHDASIPLEEVEQIETELTAHGGQHQVFVYPAGHGFFCDRRESYRPNAAAEAWQKVLQLFQAQLQTQL